MYTASKQVHSGAAGISALDVTIVMTARRWQELSDCRLTHNPTESSHVTTLLTLPRGAQEDLTATHTNTHCSGGHTHTHTQDKSDNAFILLCTCIWNDPTLTRVHKIRKKHTDTQDQHIIKNIGQRGENIERAQTAWRTPTPSHAQKNRHKTHLLPTLNHTSGLLCVANESLLSTLPSLPPPTPNSAYEKLLFLTHIFMFVFVFCWTATKLEIAVLVVPDSA